MCTTLYDSANSFVHQHFVEVSLSEEFLSLRPDEVLELVGCDELNVKAEEQVWLKTGLIDRCSIRTCSCECEWSRVSSWCVKPQRQNNCTVI